MRTQAFPRIKVRKAQPRYLGVPKATSRTQPEVHELVISRMAAANNSQAPIPGRVTLVRPNASSSSGELLFIDHLPVPRESWSFDAHDRILRWKGAFGGGQLHLSHAGRGAVGLIGAALGTVSVTGGSTANFICDVALDCGITYVMSSSGTVTGMAWNPDSAAWKNATWQSQRLLLSYTETPSAGIGPPTFTFSFTDKLNPYGIPWQLGVGEFSATLQLNVNSAPMQWDLLFQSNIAPPSDTGGPSTGPDTVFPYWLLAAEDAAASMINGAMQIDDLAPDGNLVGLQGTQQVPTVAGYYQASPAHAPFAVFGGNLLLDGQPVAATRADATTLAWTGLSEAHQQRLGLPAEGKLHFDRTGSLAQSGARLTVRRLAAGPALQGLADHADLHPQLHAQATAQATALADPALTIYDLLPMTSYAQNSSAQWYDAVQAAVLDDFSTIVNSYVSSDIWQLLFPDPKHKQPTLTGYLATVANSPVPGATPADWYKSLGTAVMTYGMAGGSDSNCDNMNGPRAGAWLKEQVANSAVYQAHSQLLFQYHWNILNPLTAQFLSDQVTNATSYQTAIVQQAELEQNDINTNVASNPGSPADMVQNLLKEVTEASNYAISNNLYWAFYYYTYNTAPAILANIAALMSTNAGGQDGTAMPRLFQQNISVLTALDPSGYFARQYNSTINTFMATNILPSMYGFMDDPSTFSLVKEYLQTFVSQNLNNQDTKIAEAASQLNAMLSSADADAMLQNSIGMLRTFSEAIQETMSLPYIAQRWVAWFSTTYPKLSTAANMFGSLLVGGITSMAIFSLVTQYRDWSKLNAAERTELVLNTAQFGLQIMAAVVSRGVKIYAILGVEGLSGWQRAGAVSRIMAQGDASALSEGMSNIGNKMARWLGGATGLTEEETEISLLMNIGQNDVEEVSWTARVFGSNLDEFLATRVGAVLVLAGIGLSIYFLTQSSTGISLATDIVNLVGGAITLFGIAGGWAVEGGLVAADGLFATLVPMAGPLAIIAALVGVGLMLYEMFKNQPDPVQEFVDNYVKPAGFYVASNLGAIDYAVSYANSNGLLLVGSAFLVGSQALLCSAGGNVALGSVTNLPDSVWQVSTDALGQSQFITLGQFNNQTIGLALSLMSDNSVSFQPALRGTAPASTGGTTPAVLTQTWLSAPGVVTTTKNAKGGKVLATLALTLQPVLPNSQQQYQPAQALGWLVQQGTGLAYSATGPATTFSLQMEGLAPNGMTMPSLKFLAGTTPSLDQVFGPNFGIAPSTPLLYTCTPALPSFLQFNVTTGKITPTGAVVPAPPATPVTNYTLEASNVLNSDSAPFTVTINS